MAREIVREGKPNITRLHELVIRLTNRFGGPSSRIMQKLLTLAAELNLSQLDNYISSDKRAAISRQRDCTWS